MTGDDTVSHLLAPLRLAARAVRRALWRHVGRFVTETPPAYGRGRRRERGRRGQPPRPLRRVS